VDLGGLLYFFIGFSAAALRAAKHNTSPIRLWLRAFLISIALWVVLAVIGFVTAAGSGEFDLGLLVFSFLLDAGWAGAGAILGVGIARRRALKK
jgi:hypothetical protein